MLGLTVHLAFGAQRDAAFGSQLLLASGVQSRADTGPCLSLGGWLCPVLHIFDCLAIRSAFW